MTTEPQDRSRSTRGGVYVLTITGLLILIKLGQNAEGWVDVALLGIGGIGLLWGALRLARFVREHGDEIGEARFDTRNKE
jgi:hypothetical protein